MTIPSRRTEALPSLASRRAAVLRSVQRQSKSLSWNLLDLASAQLSDTARLALRDAQATLSRTGPGHPATCVSSRVHLEVVHGNVYSDSEPILYQVGLHAVFIIIRMN